MIFCKWEILFVTFIVSDRYLPGFQARGIQVTRGMMEQYQVKFKENIKHSISKY